MNCREVTKLVSESLDGKLPLHKRIGVWLHFAVCRCCARYQQNLRLIKEVLRIRRERFEKEEAPGESALSAEARDRMKNILKSR